MGQALYRKYRSKKLSEVVGQEHITTALEGSLKKGRISHAYLFTGPRGVGKTSIARILAHEINQLAYTNDDLHLDIIEIDAASNRRIDDIRDLREKVHIAPVSAKFKVYIIDEVHMLTGESFNALLKTLEEPPAHVVFILATTEAHKLPATIISRTQRYGFRPVEKAKVVKHLKHIAKQEKIEVDPTALELIAEHGDGSFRDSISLLDQLANVSEGPITPEIVEQTLGLAPKKAISTLLVALKKGDHQAVAASLADLENGGSSTTVLVGQLLAGLRDEALKEPKLFMLIDALLDVPKAHHPQLKLLTVLMGFAVSQAQPEPKHVATVSAPPKPVLEVAATPKEIRQSPPITHTILEEPTPPPDAPDPEPDAEPPGPVKIPQSSTKLTEITDEQWASIVQRCKADNPPLYAVVRMATPQFNPANQVLTLTFRFALHGKKLQDAKHKTKLASIIAELLGSCPEITMSTDKDAVPPEISSVSAPVNHPPAEVDEQTKSVLDMMGGGEIMHHAETA